MDFINNLFSDWDKVFAPPVINKILILKDYIWVIGGKVTFLFIVAFIYQFIHIQFFIQSNTGAHDKASSKKRWFFFTTFFITLFMSCIIIYLAGQNIALGLKENYFMGTGKTLLFCSLGYLFLGFGFNRIIPKNFGYSRFM